MGYEQLEWKVKWTTGWILKSQLNHNAWASLIDSQTELKVAQVTLMNARAMRCIGGKISGQWGARGAYGGAQTNKCYLFWQE